MEAANKAETARLEAELKGYKNNLIKESIRVWTMNPKHIFPQVSIANFVPGRWATKTLANTSRTLEGSRPPLTTIHGCAKTLAPPGTS